MNLKKLRYPRNYWVRVPRWFQMLFPGITWSLPGKGEVLWTIDDGPNPESTPGWLELLDELNYKAVFFLTGQHYQAYPKLVEKILSAGHRIGSHGHTHLDGWKTPTHEYLEDVDKSSSLMDSVVFRPPYGRLRIGQYTNLRSRYEIFMWTVMSGDFDSRVSPRQLWKRINNVGKGDIVVFHDHPACLNKVKEALKHGTSAM